MLGGHGRPGGARLDRRRHQEDGDEVARTGAEEGARQEDHRIGGKEEVVPFEDRRPEGDDVPPVPQPRTPPPRKPAPGPPPPLRAAARKAPPAKRVTWRNRQLAPAPQRYKEIQEALAAKGYLKSEDANGAWNQASVDRAEEVPGRAEP